MILTVLAATLPILIVATVVLHTLLIRPKEIGTRPKINLEKKAKFVPEIDCPYFMTHIWEQRLVDAGVISETEMSTCKSADCAACCKIIFLSYSPVPHRLPEGYSTGTISATRITAGTIKARSDHRPDLSGVRRSNPDFQDQMRKVAYKRFLAEERANRASTRPIIHMGDLNQTIDYDPVMMVDRVFTRRGSMMSVMRFTDEMGDL